ncbi:hypothetical protein [Aquabacterium sp.]|uniref:hypothetical protein n=1 Tax=Aquabacterium sp. TaxID=1872578 RepID=UPI0019BE7914|nr:hypothetical protein [Aquabacterium sp.]MBC7700857.1 hypothetical protein [Aquabacterium sp.]
MMRSRSLRLAIILFACPLAAHAYVDPGSGMLMIQGLLALIGAVVVFVRNPITAIKALIARFKKK